MLGGMTKGIVMLDASALGPVLGLNELSQLIKKSPRSILADRSRAPHRLPPDCTPPGTRAPIWLLTDVLDWLKQYRHQPGERQTAVAPTTPAPRRGPGRPTKAEALARAAATAERG